MTPPVMPGGCKECPIVEMVEKHDKTLYGDETDLEGNPGMVGYLREVRKSLRSMNIAIWVIASALIMFLFGFSPKEIIMHLITKL